MLLHSHLASPKTACVIGGAGFIGRAVVTELLSTGREVIIVGRREAPVGLPSGVRYLANPSGTDLELVKRALEASTEVIDLAYGTSPGTSFHDPVNDILLNVPETVRVFELASRMPHLQKIVWVSSGGTVYGRTSPAPINEAHATLPISPYGITKLALEKYAHMYFETRQLPIVCVRPANAYGQGQRPYASQGFIATAIASILDGRELSLYGEHGTVRDYLHVTDMASGIVAALEVGEPGEVYNIGSGQGLTNRQVLDMLSPWAEAKGCTLEVRVLPTRPFDVPVNVLDSRKIQSLSHWKPRLSMAEGLAQTWDWYAARPRSESYASFVA